MFVNSFQQKDILKSRYVDCFSDIMLLHAPLDVLGNQTLWVTCFMGYLLYCDGLDSNLTCNISRVCLCYTYILCLYIYMHICVYINAYVYTYITKMCQLCSPSNFNTLLTGDILKPQVFVSAKTPSQLWVNNKPCHLAKAPAAP